MKTMPLDPETAEVVRLFRTADRLTSLARQTRALARRMDKLVQKPEWTPAEEDAWRQYQRDRDRILTGVRLGEQD